MGLLLQASVVQSAVATMTKEDLRAKLEQSRCGHCGRAAREGLEGQRGENQRAPSVSMPPRSRVLAATYPKDTTLVLYCA